MYECAYRAPSRQAQACLDIHKVSFVHLSPHITSISTHKVSFDLFLEPQACRNSQRVSSFLYMSFNKNNHSVHISRTAGAEPATTNAAEVEVGAGGDEDLPRLTDWKIEMNPRQEYVDPIRMHYSYAGGVEGNSIVQWFRQVCVVLQCVAMCVARELDCKFKGILIERNPPPRGVFLFTMFPDQEPGERGLPLKNHPQN